MSIDRIIRAVYPANYRSPRTRANSRELERTRANSARTRQRFANTVSPPNSGGRSPEYAERSPEFSGVRSSSPEFARTPPRTGERFARKFVRGKKSQTSFAANEVCCELRSPRTTTLANVFAKNFQKMPIIVRFRERVRLPRTVVRRELQFAAN